MPLFHNRLAAAEELARHLVYLRAENPIVLGLANDGVQIAEVVARSLDAPLDVLLVERLMAPDSRDQVVGVVDELGRVSMIESTARWHHVSSQQMIGPARGAFRILQRKRGRVRAILPSLEMRGRTVIIVSEGIGAGARMLGAIASVRDRGAKKIIVGAPAGASKTTWQLHDTADQVVIPHRPTKFTDVRDFYEEYAEISDDLLLAMLKKWVASRPQEEASAKTLVMKVTNDNQQMLSCEIDLPPGMTRDSGPYPAVIFVHGFESDARSARSLPISRRLAERGVIGVRPDFTGHGRSEGTLEEANDVQMYKDLFVLHQNVARLNEVDARRIGINGSGNGGLIAMHYAANHPEIRALVIRGPVCGSEVEAASKVKAPTLLIHADKDTALFDTVAALNNALGSTHELLRIPQSSRLFNDPISRELMIDSSVNWLADHLIDAPVGPEAAAGNVETSKRRNVETGVDVERG